MLFYKDKNIERKKTKHRMLGIGERMEKML